MSDLFPQQSRVFRRLTAACIILLSALPFLGFDPRTINYTGLFQQRPIITWLCMGCALALQCFLYFSALRQTTRRYGLSLILLIGVLLLMIIPYRNEQDLSTNLHLLLSFAVLVLLNVLVIEMLLLKPKLLSFYFAGCLFAFFLALTAASINGLSELVYGAVLTLVLCECA